MDAESKILESDAMAKRLKKLRTEYKYIGTDGKQHHLSHAVLSQRLEEFGVSVSVSTLKNTSHQQQQGVEQYRHEHKDAECSRQALQCHC